MATTPEGKVKQKIREIFKRYGVWYCMPNMNGMGSNGVPDFLACAWGLFVAVEAKAGRGKPTELQAIQIDRINRSGGVALVINESNLDVLDGVLHERQTYVMAKTLVEN